MVTPAILVHGGAGQIFDDERAETCAQGCMRAARTGYEILVAGGSAVDAAQAAAVVLEDDPNFNAGTGSALNVDGIIEQDAMLMDGCTLRAGGIAALRGGFKNAILIARRVMDDSPHVLLAAEGAAKFARQHGIEPGDAQAMITERVLARWHREKEAGWPRKPGTIGAVTADRDGHVACASSTGGISGKLAGRIGDTPMIGGGTYADDRTGAAGATGHGESCAKVVLAKLACDRLAAGDDPYAAARFAIAELERIDGEGGVILVSPDGRVGFAFNTARMSRAWISADGEGSGFEPA